MLATKVMGEFWTFIPFFTNIYYTLTFILFLKGSIMLVIYLIIISNTFINCFIAGLGIIIIIKKALRKFRVFLLMKTSKVVTSFLFQIFKQINISI